MQLALIIILVCMVVHFMIFVEFRLGEKKNAQLRQAELIALNDISAHRITKCSQQVESLKREITLLRETLNETASAMWNMERSTEDCLIRLKGTDPSQSNNDKVSLNVKVLNDRDQRSAKIVEKLQNMQSNAIDLVQNTILKGVLITPKVHIVTQIHRAKEDHFREILLALQMNLLNPFVAKIHLLQEEGFSDVNFFKNLINSDKIQLVNSDRWIDFKLAVEYIHRNIENDTIVSLMNSDAYFDNTLVYSHKITPKTTYAVSRRATLVDQILMKERDNIDQCDEYQGSHDAFIFMTPISDELVKQAGAVQMGKLGYENVIIHTLRSTGYTVLNPCQTINLWHVHSHRTFIIPQERVNEDLNVPFHLQLAEPSSLQ